MANTQDSSLKIILGLTKSPPENKFRWLSTDNQAADSNLLDIVLNDATVIPVYSHSYLATIPDSALSVTDSALSVTDSALSVTDSALLSASQTRSQPGWITVEVTSNPGGNPEEINFLGQRGLHTAPDEPSYRLSTTSEANFTTYMYGSQGQAAACHQLGVDTGSSGGYSALVTRPLDVEALLVSIQEDETERCPEQSTVPLSPSRRKRESVFPGVYFYEFAATTVEATEELPLCGFTRLNITPSSEEFQEMLESISKYIKVDQQNTSQSRRKKESAPDNRMSSVSVGVFSCSLIFVSLGMIVLVDITSIVAALSGIVRGGAGMEEIKPKDKMHNSSLYHNDNLNELYGFLLIFL
ncbi:hypothetical protein RRG08_033504 [Elysia crispata]|uniref:Uncharacterized protein n=1 Tax=Elysia crispata TaxID=231223 RepID=A0AAE1ATW7_9GAST|nr:hypothetical protein RRG08_033504 [Elysia crispata]